MARIPYGLRRATFLLRSEVGLYSGVTLRGQVDAHQRQRVKELQQQRHLKLHLACGDRLLPDWVNIDLVPMADLRLDLRDPLPLPDGCAQLIYASHYLEHLDYRREVPPFLKECHRLLEPGGVLRLWYRVSSRCCGPMLPRTTPSSPSRPPYTRTGARRGSST